MIKKEYKFILEIIKASFGNKKSLICLHKMLEDKTLNWVEILGYLCYHRIGGLAFHTIVNNFNVYTIDFPIFFILDMIYQAQSVRMSIQNSYIKILSSMLCKADIPHVFLKGAVLSNTIYPPGTRASNDIDILISRKSVPKITKILNKLGFIQGKFDYKKETIKKFNKEEVVQHMLTKGELAPFIKIINEKFCKIINIDVNLSLSWKLNDSDEVVDYFLENRISIPIDKDQSIFSLKEEHLFIHLCNHFYKECVLLDIIKKRKVFDLYKFVDIFAFIQKYFDKIDIEKVFHDSVKFGFDKYVFFTLRYVIEVFPELLSIEKVKMLYQKYNYLNPKFMTEVFDQNNFKIKFKLQSKKGLIERLFTYNIIKEYEQYHK